MLRIGFVGTGVIAWAHALGLQAMIADGTVDAELTMAHDINPKRIVPFARATGATVANDVDSVIDGADAVWVCTPTSEHLAVVQQAARRGRAVFCEKPLAPDLAGARELAASVATAGVPAQVGLVLRAIPVFRALRDIIASGELGPPMAALFRDDQYFPIQGHYGSTWRSDVRIAGGGCLIEHSIHDLDILRFCLGEVTEVAARTANMAGYEGIEDVASVHLRFESGASADLLSVWHGILSRGSTRRIEVFCRDGMAWLDDDVSGPLHVQTGNGVEERSCRAPAWVSNLPLADDEIGLAVRSYVEADRAFVDAITAGRSPAPSLDEGVIAHRLVDAAYRSASAGGMPIKIS